MSRIGKLPIQIPGGVQVDISDNNTVKVKGPKGELFQQVDRDITVSLEDGVLVVKRPSEQKRDRKSVVEGKSVSVRVDLGGRRVIKKKKPKAIRKRNNRIK